MGKNAFLLNPNTEEYSFGVVPHIEHSGYIFEEGEIKLRQGRHNGPNKGFGAAHIWVEHKCHLQKNGYETVEDVARFIADIIKPRCSIYCEFNSLRGKHRLTVVRTSMGVVVLEEQRDGDNQTFYSVVTAFERKSAHGTRIGTVR